MAQDVSSELHATERKFLEELRGLRRRQRARTKSDDGSGKLSLGQRMADGIAAGMGSWRFIIIQSLILIFWVAANVIGFMMKWDPYPFILLNLALSFQAAYAAPIIMMSQNRQSDIDRRKAENDYNVNIKAELEIELLHQKIDELRAKEMLALTQAISDLTQHVKNETLAAAAPTKAARTKVAKPAAAKARKPAVSRSPRAARPK